MVKKRQTELTGVQEEKQNEGMTVEVEAMQLEEGHPEEGLSAPEDGAVGDPESKNPPKSCSLPQADGLQEEIPKEEVSECKHKISAVQRTSARVSKRIKKEVSTSLPQPQHAIRKPVNKQNPQPEQLRTRRSWELWSVEDKNSFFDALCEFGKDFENIQSYIAQRSKKKGVLPSIVKNKDQVRHFYYRTWHKISKYLDISDDVKKQTQELYGLINYAELRKKIGGCLNEKNRQKLNDLVLHGVTTVKYRGKKLRIKTPICRALKKLNCVDEVKEPEGPKLPKEIYVELRPKTNAAWLHVQNLAQNPRLRTKVTLQRRLSSIISYLQRRWKPLRLLQMDQITQHLPSTSSSPHLPEQSPVLRVRPRQGVTVSPMSVSSVDSTSFTNVCLENHVKNLHSEQKDKEPCKHKKVPVVRAKSKSKCSSVHCEESSDKLNVVSDSAEKLSSPETETPQKNPDEEAKRSLSLLKNMLQSIENSSEGHKTDCATSDELEKSNVESSTEKTASVDMYLSTQTENASMTLGQLLSLATEGTDKKVSIDDEKVKANSSEDKEGASDTKPANVETQRILKGWTLEDVGLLTIGELYLMLNCPEKLVLEYEFESRPLISSTSTSSDDSSKQQNQCSSEMQHFGLILKKLVTVASSYFIDFKNKQSPLSPTNRVSSHNRLVTTPTNKPASARNIGRNPGTKTTGRVQLENKNQEVVSAEPQQMLSADLDAPTPVEPQKAVVSESSDKHVFVVPIRAAPRNLKANNLQDSVRKQLDLAPCRRNHRQKRKPLVIKRALLPRANEIRPRPMSAMTVVHLLPSSGPLAAVLPPQAQSTSIQKMVLPPAKKIMKVLPTVSGNPVDVRSLQIPLFKPVTSGGTIVLPANNLPTAHVVGTTHGIVNPVQPLTTRVLERKTDTLSTLNTIAQSVTHLSVVCTTSGSSAITSSTATSKRPTLGGICIESSSGTSPPQISIPENATHLSPPNISSLLEISLPGTLPAGSLPGTNADHLIDFNENSNSSLSVAFGLNTPVKDGSKTKCLTVDPMVSQRQATPPQSPSSRFKVNSPGPDAQWLNGESADFSLNSLLNTFESPCKNSVHSATDASSLDSMSRLAPDVDTHLQCLINESSVDYVAKFADLAAQIASTSSESKNS